MIRFNLSSFPSLGKTDSNHGKEACETASFEDVLLQGFERGPSIFRGKLSDSCPVV